MSLALGGRGIEAGRHGPPARGTVSGAAAPAPSRPDSLRPTKRWGCLTRRWLAAFPDPGRLATQRAQVVQLGPAHPAPGDDLDLVQGRAVHREGALHAHAVA